MTTFTRSLAIAVSFATLSAHAFAEQPAKPSPITNLEYAGKICDKVDPPRDSELDTMERAETPITKACYAVRQKMIERAVTADAKMWAFEAKQRDAKDKALKASVLAITSAAISHPDNAVVFSHK